MRGQGLARIALAIGVLGFGFGARASAVSPPEPDADAAFRERVDRAAAEVLASTGTPSASIAIVRDGKIAYVKAYGDAKLTPKVPARSEMRYSIGSNSKQFTATGILMLAEEGKLSLDDPVSRFVPDLTRAADVRVRHLLSHTSGYQDYWPQDYVPPFMTKPVTAADILDRWAKKPLDFEPGTQYQYSNTGYVIAGVILEKASGEKLLPFLTARIFKPLQMNGVVNVDQDRLTESDPVGYLRYALGPPRPAPDEGKGWLFAAGELAMTAEDLAKWNVGMLEKRLLKPASYQEQQTDVLLKSGLAAGYGLGLDVEKVAGHRALAHGGAVSGFTSQNVVFPDDDAAITVLTNGETVAPQQIAERLAPILFEKRDAVAASQKRAREILAGLQAGKVDRSLFTANANSYFTEQAVKDFAGSLSPLGVPTELKQTRQNDRGGMTFRLFKVTYPKKTVEIWERDMPDGKIEQFQVGPTAD
ncbi:MAG TPA: serine hydrolase domain-containing protein [Thermoanaerobaculia bacterium]|jgi:CubicO group peptidase (beta-lactamase class C family)